MVLDGVKLKDLTVQGRFFYARCEHVYIVIGNCFVVSMLDLAVYLSSCVLDDDVAATTRCSLFVRCCILEQSSAGAVTAGVFLNLVL